MKTGQIFVERILPFEIINSLNLQDALILMCIFSLRSSMAYWLLQLWYSVMQPCVHSGESDCTLYLKTLLSAAFGSCWKDNWRCFTFVCLASPTNVFCNLCDTQITGFLMMLSMAPSLCQKIFPGTIAFFCFLNTFFNRRLPYLKPWFRYLLWKKRKKQLIETQIWWE